MTVADRQAEQLLRERIAAAFPDDAILGEEFPDRPGTSGYRWILDPIDGTKSFIHGVPLYGTLIGLEHEIAKRAGNHRPAGARRMFVRGRRAGRVVRSRQPTRRCGPTFPNAARWPNRCFARARSPASARRGAAAVYDRLQAAARLSRTWGDCYGYLLVATGRAELMVDPIMSVWDAAAILPILEEAGGTFTDWQGRPTIHSGEGLATNGRVLEEALAILRMANQHRSA